MLDELRAKLRLRNTPKRIECYDISNLQGTMVVASQVVFDEGLARKDLYRRYRIRTVAGQDDFASMVEVLSRRLARAVEEQEYPDLIVVDGGKGQLNMALQVLRELGWPIRLTRSARQAARAQWAAPARGGQVRGARVPPQSQGSDRAAAEFDALFLLVRVRDEAHRFAITYNRELRRRVRLRYGPRRHRRYRTGAPARACCATSAASSGFARPARRS